MPFRLQQSFAAGEISLRMRGLSGNELFNAGLRRLQNGIITKFGSVFKRPGTEFLFGTEGNERVVIIPMTVRGDADYFVTVGSNNVVVYRSDATAFVPQRTTVSASSPWSQAQLPEIQWAQNETQMFLVHPGVEPRVLERNIIDDTWTFAVIDTNFTGPRLEPKAQPVTLSQVRVDANNVEWEMSQPLFQATDDEPSDAGNIHFTNGYMQMTRFLTPTRALFSHFDIDPTGDAGTDPGTLWRMWVSGAQLTGTWTCTAGVPGDMVTVTRTGGSSDFIEINIGLILDYDYGGTAQQFFFKIISITSTTIAEMLVLHGSPAALQLGTDSRQFLEVDRTDEIRLGSNGISGTTRVSASPVSSIFVSGDAGAGAEQGGLIYMNGGTARITSFVDSGTVDVVPVDLDIGLGNTITLNLESIHNTSFWDRGWSIGSGYPSAVAFHQDRLWFGGISRFSNRLYSSRSGRHLDFTPGALDDDALILSPSADNSSEGIQWLRSAGDFLVGTEQSEFSAKGRPITPTSLSIDKQSTYGGASVQPVQVGASIMFVGRNKKSIRELEFSFETDRYSAPDLVDIADSLFFADQIIQLSYVRYPDTLILCAMRDETSISLIRDLRVLNFRKENGVRGWGTWTIPAVSCATLPIAGDPTRDQTWFVVERIIDGVTQRFIEKIDSTQIPMDSQFTDDLDGDGTHTFSGGNVTVTVGVNHLDEEEVQVVADGSFRGNFTISGGTLVFPAPSNPTVVTFGLKMEFRMQPNHLEFEEFFGNTPGIEKTIDQINILVNASVGGKLDGFDLPDIAPIVVDVVPTPRRQWITVSGTKRFGSSEALEIQHDDPFNFEVLAVNTQYTTNQAVV